MAPGTVPEATRLPVHAVTNCSRKGGRMSAARLEAFLAKIYVDEDSRERFLVDPRGEAAKAGLNEQEIGALEKIDRAGLILTAQSLQKKRRRLSGKRS